MGGSLWEQTLSSPLTQPPLGVPAQDLLTGREGDFWPALPTEYDNQSWVATVGQSCDCPALSGIKQEEEQTLLADAASQPNELSSVAEQTFWPPPAQLLNLSIWFELRRERGCYLLDPSI